MMKTVERVGAIQSANEHEVRFYGYGVYVRDKVPPSNVGGFNLGIESPCITLDNGGEVYGCECWWGTEEEIKNIISDKKVIMVKPERSEYNHE